MRIDPKTTASPIASVAAARRRAGSGGFTVSDQESPRAASGAGAAAPVGSLDALLALQEEAGEGDRRRRAARRGHDILDALDRLKAALLSGRVPISDLKVLAQRLAERRDATGDPRLDEVIAHIELRAKVELAKLGTDSQADTPARSNAGS
ncbi:MAG: flagellar assembly protein FliX [Salinarimonas sp.]